MIKTLRFLGHSRQATFLIAISLVMAMQALKFKLRLRLNLFCCISFSCCNGMMSAYLGYTTPQDRKDDPWGRTVHYSPTRYRSSTLVLLTWNQAWNGAGVSPVSQAEDWDYQKMVVRMRRTCIHRSSLSPSTLYRHNYHRRSES
ncbi:hypothetical protein EDB83DRAFT_2430677 [Lactarius deliciosus]|nr:hypothetical protein EDB83DRAFT_2430677 [Lactarius deliciosus]